MAGKGGNRQQKQAAKAVRRRQAVAAKQQAERLASSPARQIAAAAACPLDRCLRLADIADEGMGHVVLARRLPSGKLGCAFFLVDLWCLGVKDVFYREAAASELDEQIAKLEARGQVLVPIDPPSAKGLILGAVAFAARYGISPAKDYRTIVRLFDGIDAEAATETFAYGKNGKPLFVPGPSDTPARIREIQRTLRPHLGPVDEKANAEANLGLIRRLAAALKRSAGFAETDDVDFRTIIEHEGSPERDEAGAASALPAPKA